MADTAPTTQTDKVVKSFDSPFPLPLSKSSFDEIVAHQRGAVIGSYLAQRNVYLESEIGSEEDRKTIAPQLIEPLMRKFANDFPKFAHEDPFEAFWLPTESTIPAFPHEEILLAAKEASSPVDTSRAESQSSSGDIWAHIESGQRLLAIPLDELLKIPYLDTLLFRFALSRKFDYANAADRFLKLREFIYDNKISFKLTDEIRAGLALGTFAFPPVIADALSHDAMIPRPMSEPPVHASATTSESNVPKPSPITRWFYRMPSAFIRPRVLTWDKTTTESYIRAWFYFIFTLLSSDWTAQTHGLCLVGSLKGAGLSNLNRSFQSAIGSALQHCLPIKIHKVFMANDNFFVHNIVWPLMKLILSTKMQSKMNFIGKKYELILAELPADRVMRECGGTIDLPDQCNVLGVVEHYANPNWIPALLERRGLPDVPLNPSQLQDSSLAGPVTQPSAVDQPADPQLPVGVETS